MATTQPRISPTLQTTTTSSSTSSSKKFLVRRRQPSWTTTKSGSTVSLGDSESSTQSAGIGTKKRSSLLKRLWKSQRGRSSLSSSRPHKASLLVAVDSHTTHSLHSGSLGLQSTVEEEEEEGRTSNMSSDPFLPDASVKEDDDAPRQHQDDDDDDDDTTARQEEDDEETEEASRLLQSGLKERRAGQLQGALMTWNLALDVLSHRPDSPLAQELVCRMISLYLQLYRTTAESSHLDAAASLVAQLQDNQGGDVVVASKYLDGSPLVLDLLMQQSCWSMALQVTHKLPEVDPLTLARLHLEVALRDNNNNATTTTSVDPQCQQPPQQRSSQLSHLSECHQLLLAFDPSDATNDSTSTDLYQSLWQELAQAYGVMGEEELALGCSQSRMQHWSSIHDVALGHYDQALGVYTPAGQYSLALKEVELAMATLRRCDGNSKRSINPDDNETKVTESLWMKFYQFKADILCRMGRIGESIDNYKIVLEWNRTSSNRGEVDAANVLFILGKLSVRNKDFQGALDYFTEELQMTKTVVGNTHLAISKILHELARVAESGLMDFPMAVQYYQEALQVERGVYQQCKREQQEQKLISAASAALLKDAKSQIGETKQCLGKLHFKLGDFNRAVKTTLAVDK